jgi:RHS repeat-associated protein
VSERLNPDGYLGQAEPMWYHTNFIGSVYVLTDATGAVVELYDYDAYGIPLTTPTGVTNPFRYVGQLGYYRDPDHSLMLLGARYYDPTLGRFISQDPIGYEGGMNLYGYVRGNPVNAADPSGLGFWDWLKRHLFGRAEPIFKRRPSEFEDDPQLRDWAAAANTGNALQSMFSGAAQREYNATCQRLGLPALDTPGPAVPVIVGGAMKSTAEFYLWGQAGRLVALMTDAKVGWVMARNQGAVWGDLQKLGCKTRGDVPGLMFRALAEGKMTRLWQSPYGTQFNMELLLTTVAGEQKKLVAGWIILENENVARFVTSWVGKP